MLDVLQVGAHRRHLGGMHQDVVVKILLVVDLVNQLIDAGGRCGSAAFGWLRANDLTVANNKLLVEGGCKSEL